MEGLQEAEGRPGEEGVVNGNRVWAKTRRGTVVFWEYGSIAVDWGSHAGMADEYGTQDGMWEEG